MFINKRTLALWCVAVGSAAAFSTQVPSTTRLAFVGRTAGIASIGSSTHHAAGCPCPSCTVTFHTASCACPGCNPRHDTALFADVAAGETEASAAVAEDDDDEIPAEVAALDGVDDEDEAHNLDRPARQQLRKKKDKGTELGELTLGTTVTGTVRSITSYGAFVDIGATTDGLLHISQLSTEYVGSVNDVLQEGQEVQVRIVNVDTTKGQVGLSMMTAEQASDAQESSRQSNRPNRQQNTRREDNSSVLNSLKEKGWDSSVMVEGTVVSTVDFGCFVRLDASKLNSDCEGSFDGLVHISALRKGRVASVTDIVKPDEKVQVRVKSIDGNKVSLTMLSTEDEESKADSSSDRGGFDDAGPGNGAANWKELLVDFDTDKPAFQNFAVIEDRRK